MSDKLYWQQKILEEIPLCRAMGLTINRLNQLSIEVQAPLAKNINGHATGFAGSIYTLAIAAGWTLLSYSAQQANLTYPVVAGKATIKYNKPITTDFVASCYLSTSKQSANELYSQWLGRLKSNRSVRIPLSIGICEINQPIDSHAAIVNADYYLTIK
ncbi:MAG: YiiD C-terminal domain-containing protein [Kangiellaceae bacterium]|jgi:thioesterase domain-containing protein|nr:YiiD C-terminal domain-containing protein [Kangiellaceae bacterium]